MNSTSIYSVFCIYQLPVSLFAPQVLHKLWLRNIYTYPQEHFVKYLRHYALYDWSLIFFAFGLVLTYDLMDDRRLDDVNNNVSVVLLYKTSRF